MRYSIVTMTRGDAGKIGEWLEHHARLGFDDVQLVLDGDVDGTADSVAALEPRLRDLVTLHPRPEVGEYYDGLTAEERRDRVASWREANADLLEKQQVKARDPIAWRQFHRLPEVLEPYAAGERGRGWLALIDVDEFLVLPPGESIGSFVAHHDVPRLQFLNLNVDTSGHDPARPVLEQHTRRWAWADVQAHPDRRWATRVKSVVRYRCAAPLRSIHRITFGKHTVVDPDVARLHHFRMPNQLMDPEIPYSVDDPIGSG